jgi:hypothetical protein
MGAEFFALAGFVIIPPCRPKRRTKKAGSRTLRIPALLVFCDELSEKFRSLQLTAPLALLPRCNSHSPWFLHNLLYHSTASGNPAGRVCHSNQLRLLRSRSCSHMPSNRPWPWDIPHNLLKNTLPRWDSSHSPQAHFSQNPPIRPSRSTKQRQHHRQRSNSSDF